MQNIDLDNMPLFKAILGYVKSDPIPFHMPGHKLGKGFLDESFRRIGLFDLTEIPGTDNLHHPEGPLKEALQLTAQAFGAEQSFFLVNGSTAGVQAAVMSVCGSGEKLIVSRDCHKSVINGLALAGGIPVYVKPGYNRSFGISSGVDPSDIAKALDENPDCRGVFITRPNYYGICCDIDEIVRIVHLRGKVLIVDEAHGAHFRFEEGLPKSAMDAGADICIQSAHKTLPALTQCALLHIKGSRADRDKVAFYLGMLQTSSPSYILMASLDMCREVMQKSGSLLLKKLIINIENFKEAMEQANCFHVLSERHLGGFAHDCTRIVVNTGSMGITGFEADRLLRSRYNIQVEMADLFNVVSIATVSDGERDFSALFKALSQTADENRGRPGIKDMMHMDFSIPPMASSPGSIAKKRSVHVKLKEAAGRISSRMVTPFPPGVPALCPGEVITREVIGHLNELMEAGGTVNGISGDMEISVWDEEGKHG